MAVYRVLIIMLIYLLSIESTVSAKVVTASKNGRIPFEAGLQVLLTDFYKNNNEPASIYENALGSVPCYEQRYNMVMTLWAVDNYGSITPEGTDPGADVLWDVKKPSHFTALQIKSSGIYYWSQSTLCSKCQWECRTVEDSSTESFTFDVYPACPKTTVVSQISGTVTADNKTVTIGDSISYAAQLETGANGKVELTFPDGSVVRLGKNSKIKFDCTEQTSPGMPISSRITLLLGRIWSLVTPDETRNYEVVTERLITGVRGTEYEVIKGQFADSVIVATGKVAVINSLRTDSTILSYCEAAQVNDDGVLRSIDAFSTENIDCGGIISVFHKKPMTINGKDQVMTEYFNIAGQRIKLNKKAYSHQPGILIRKTTDQFTGKMYLQSIITTR